MVIKVVRFDYKLLVVSAHTILIEMKTDNYVYASRVGP